MKAIAKFLKNGIKVSLSCDKHTTLQDIKIHVILAYLDYYHNNISKVSRTLNISRQTLYNILKDYKCEVTEQSKC